MRPIHLPFALAGGDEWHTATWVDALLLLSTVTEPHADHFLLHVQLLSNHKDLLGGRFLVLGGTVKNR